MAKDGFISVSPKHGVNPSIAVCMFCGGDTGELVLMGMLRGDVEAPRKVVLNDTPCTTCQNIFSQGILFMCVKGDPNRSEGLDWFTGKYSVLREEAMSRLPFTDIAKAEIITKRRAALDEETWDKLGFNNVPNKG